MPELAPVYTDGVRVFNFWGRDLGSFASSKADLIGKRKKWETEGVLMVFTQRGVYSKEVHGPMSMKRAWKWVQAWNAAAQKEREKDGQAQPGNGPVNSVGDDPGGCALAAEDG